MKIMEDLDKYLNTNKKTSLDDGSHEVCDLVTGECYIVKEKDGLIERHDNTKVSNRNVKVKTHGGLKELLND
jgi:hypothetical protein